MRVFAIITYDMTGLLCPHRTRVVVKSYNPWLNGTHKDVLKEAQLTLKLQNHGVMCVRRCLGYSGMNDVVYQYYPYTLHDLFHRHSGVGHSPLQLVRSNFQQTCIQLFQCLHALHSRHILHLDLKPSNIFIDYDGTLAIGDFGLSIELNATSRQKEVKPRRGPIGTQAYRAPCMWTQHSASEANDIWAVVVILIEIGLGAKLNRKAPHIGPKAIGSSYCWNMPGHDAKAVNRATRVNNQGNNVDKQNDATLVYNTIKGARAAENSGQSAERDNKETPKWAPRDYQKGKEKRTGKRKHPHTNADSQFGGRTLAYRTNPNVLTATSGDTYGSLQDRIVHDQYIDWLTFLKTYNADLGAVLRRGTTVFHPNLQIIFPPIVDALDMLNELKKLPSHAFQRDAPMREHS